MAGTVRRSWTTHEEQVLVNSLKEIVARGYKCDNGFRAGYITILETLLMAALPGTDLRGDPHIVSKIHVWKKQYASLKEMLVNGSGNGFRNDTHMVEATEEKWAAQIKKDPNARTLKNKSFPFYNDWVEIFGKDRANGENAQTFPDLIQNVLNNNSQPEPSTGLNQSPQATPINESSQTEYQSANRGECSSATTNSKKKKRRIEDTTDERFIESINLFCNKTDLKIGNMTASMSEAAQGAGSKYDSAKKREALYDILCGFDFLTLKSRVRVSQYFARNPNEMDMFFSFPVDAKAEMLLNIMNGL